MTLPLWVLATWLARICICSSPNSERFRQLQTATRSMLPQMAMHAEKGLQPST